ncbi:MAG: hypothetical protein ACTH05_08185 [Yaniella sp.]
MLAGIATILLALVLMGGFGAPSVTHSAWTRQQPAVVVFQSAHVGPIDNLHREDGAAILDGRILLSWK